MSVKTGALYFPFIDVPNSRWFCRTLLYWDPIYSIMPRQFAAVPETLSRFTQALQQHELLKPIIPEVVEEIRSLADGFAEYIRELDPRELERRRKSRRMAQVHTGKLGGSALIEYLHECRLARWIDYPWLSIEARTARDYMAYLATCIAEVHDETPRAVTDDIKHCSPLLSARDRTELELQDLRYELLDAALPIPKKRLTPEKIQLFKIKHGSLLPDFRFWIEGRIAGIADSKSEAIRQKRLDDAKKEIDHEATKIEKTLSKNGFGEFVFGDVCSILGAIPLIGKLPNMVNKIYRATHTTPKSGPMAYVAFARRDLDMRKPEKPKR